MRSSILAITALSVGLIAAPLAFAQSTNSIGTRTNDSGGGGAGQTNAKGSNGGQDAPNYLTGPGVHLFYTDEEMTTLRPAEEIRTVYAGMSVADQQMLARSCASNEDTRFADLCAAVGTF
jgi:hypothetical protein